MLVVVVAAARASVTVAVCVACFLTEGTKKVVDTMAVVASHC